MSEKVPVYFSCNGTSFFRRFSLDNDFTIKNQNHSLTPTHHTIIEKRGLYLFFFIFILFSLSFTYVMVFSDIAQKVLNGFTKSTTTSKDNIWSTLPDGLTLEMVLENRAPSPFSLKDFTDYLKSTYCHENLMFFQAVMEYKDRCTTYFGYKEDEKMVLLLDGVTVFDFSVYNKTLLSSQEQMWFEILVQKFDLILKDYILSDAPHEINIPYEVRHQLLQSHKTQLLYHPTLLYPACSAVVELMRISAFIPFATDPNRHYCPMKKKSSAFSIKKQKSSPSFINTTNYSDLPPSPPLLTPPIHKLMNKLQ